MGAVGESGKGGKTNIRGRRGSEELAVFRGPTKVGGAGDMVCRRGRAPCMLISAPDE